MKSDNAWDSIDFNKARKDLVLFRLSGGKSPIADVEKFIESVELIKKSQVKQTPALFKAKEEK